MKDSLKKLIDQMIRLLGVRSIITIALIGTLIYGFAKGMIEAKDFLIYVTMTVTFFFGKEQKEDIKKEEKTEEKGGVG